MTHLTWEQLNDYADGAMAPSARTAAASHLDVCAECRDTLARLRSLLATAKSAPASIEPPGEAWAGIRETIERQKVSALPHALLPAPRTQLPWLVAAAVLLVVASSVTTMQIMRRGAPPTVTIPPAYANGPRSDTLVLPASLVQMERGYLKTVDELTAALNDSRGKLAPETIRVVERNLKIIDDAISEARAALARDPASEVLRDVLSKNYQQKVDLLRRASARAQTT
jgi:hypothetical protein